MPVSPGWEAPEAGLHLLTAETAPVETAEVSATESVAAEEATTEATRAHAPPTAEALRSRFPTATSSKAIAKVTESA
jgi:hypothetical protein